MRSEDGEDVGRDNIDYDSEWKAQGERGGKSPRRKGAREIVQRASFIRVLMVCLVCSVSLADATALRG